LKRVLDSVFKIKLTKIIPLVVIAAMMATASASVFTQYYGSTTATVQAADIQLIAGADNLGGTVYPTASVSIATTKDFATIGISLFPSATNTPQAGTYFTDLLEIKNNAASASHTISQVSISNIVDSDSALGKITVYYCTSQTNDPANNNVGSFSITSTTGGNVLSSGQSIAHGVYHYIEIVAYAKSTASAAQAITFSLAIQWV
jgi:hypothetical protein